MSQNNNEPGARCALTLSCSFNAKPSRQIFRQMTRRALGDIDKLRSALNVDRQRSKGNHVRPPLRRDSCALIALVFQAVCAAPLASAEIFKCVTKDGTALYQNFPCQFDSIGWVPSNPQAAKTTSIPPSANQVKPQAPPVNVPPPVAPADAREARIGMTPDEVRAILGEPLESVEDGPTEGRIEIWRYVDRTIQFDRTHRVSTVEAW
jgi:uncharacterized protein DUF4124